MNYMKYFTPMNVNEWSKSFKWTKNYIAIAELLQQYHDCDLYFIDGPKSSASTGCAVIKNNAVLEKRRPLAFTQVLTAEILAIQTSVKDITKSPERQNCILSDSLSALLLLNSRNWTNPHPLAQDILNQISAVPSGTVLIWIPGDVGNLGNEVTDTAAKEALLLSPQNEQRWQPTSYWRLKTNYRNNINNTGSARHILLPINYEYSPKPLIRIYCHQEYLVVPKPSCTSCV